MLSRTLRATRAGPIPDFAPWTRQTAATGRKFRAALYIAGPGRPSYGVSLLPPRASGGVRVVRIRAVVSPVGIGPPY